MDRIADDEDVQDECSAPEDLDEDEYATTEDLDRLIQRVEALECDIFPEQELAADELPPEHGTLLSRVMTLKSKQEPRTRQRQHRRQRRSRWQGTRRRQLKGRQERRTRKLRPSLPATLAFSLG